MQNPLDLRGQNFSGVRDPRVLQMVYVARLDGPDLSLHSLFRALAGRELDLASLGVEPGVTLLNVNTPEDLARARLYQDLE